MLFLGKNLNLSLEVAQMRDLLRDISEIRGLVK